MGKRIITQRRGKGSFTYTTNSHRFKGRISYGRIGNTGVIRRLIHCCGHSAPLAEVLYDNGNNALIPAAEGIYIGQVVDIGDKALVKKGNILFLRDIPEGIPIYNIESAPGKCGFCRSSGSFARIESKSDKDAIIVLPSKKKKRLNYMCKATIGIVAGSGRIEKPIVKAGKRWHMMHAKGKLYPRTSGVAMNAVDHPFGCGRGRHMGKPKTPPRNAPPGRNVGLLRARRTGRRR